MKKIECSITMTDMPLLELLTEPKSCEGILLSPARKDLVLQRVVLVIQVVEEKELDGCGDEDPEDEDDGGHVVGWKMHLDKK